MNDANCDNDQLPSVIAGEPAGAGPALRWRGDALELLDQRLLPGEERVIRCRDADEVAEAIRAMVVRGAPALGIAAGYGLALAARKHAGLSLIDRRTALETDCRRLAEARPTAVNIANVLARFASLI